MKLFCDHDFKIIDKTILPSAWEQLEETRKDQEMEFSGSPYLFRKKIIILLKCSKCKKLKEIIEVNP